MKRHLYEGVSVTANIEKHAGAPLWPVGKKHPHKRYQNMQRLQIYDMEPELLQLVIEHGGAIKYDKQMHADVLITQVQDEEYNPFDDIKVADIQCPCDDKILYEQLLGRPEDQEEEVMAYKTCKHTIFGAAKRQMKAAPTPNENVANEFVQFCKEKITEDLEYANCSFTDFGYSYQQWYQHLNLAKQKDMDMVAKYFTGRPLTRNELRRVMQTHYEGICKVEIQGKDGKPRMVCSIPLQTKYIMGPITWKLEEIFGHHVKGYCGGKNLDEMADMINEYIKQGFTKVVEGDGSAFDNTQDVALKEVDRWIYRQVKHAVHHVDARHFMRVSQELTKTMDVIYTDKFTRKQKKMFSYTILGSVFSGDCDTTLCNTIRMAMYNRFVNEKHGLKYGEDYVCFAKGDDFTVMYKDYITDKQINDMYYKYFLPANPDPSRPDTRVFGLGQVLKMLDIGGPEILTFCSLRAWYKNNDEIILTRNPKKFMNLSKYSRRTKCMNNTQRIKYCIEQAIALETSYQGIDIFMEMARAYRIKARLIATINKTTKEQLRNYERDIQLKIKECRNPISTVNNEEDKNYCLLFNVKQRKVAYKLSQNYWETMKLLYNVRNTKLGTKELKLINQQIEAEFKVSELRSVLGLNKEFYEKKYYEW